MTLGTVSATDSSPGSCFCSCCGAKMMPYFSDDAVVSQNQINQLISESFLTVKGAALFLPRGNNTSPNAAPRITQRRNKHAGDLQQHLQTMFTLLRPEDTIRLAVRLESACLQFTRYMVVVSTNGRQDTEESVVLGMDFTSSDSVCTVGLVLPLWSDTLIHLDGDGGFSVSTVNRVHVFKPVSVQAMWSALQSLHKACEVARCHNYYPGSLFLTWVSYYQSRISSSQFCINEWNAMQDVQSHRADSPVLFTDVPTERERTERLIKTRLREIMMQKDLENVTSKEIRTELEMQMVCNLREFKEFIDNEMIVILGQMDSPTEIFDHVYLGSEWNASNLEELQNSGVRYILNVTREIDNFFPGMFEYHNIRVYDEEATNLLEYWNETYKFITKAKKAGAKCLVHCKMGVSRSASTVIAYAMKEYGWDLDTAFDHVKEKRAVTKPNPAFMKQLEEYQGILLASKQRHNKLWRSHSDSDLSERHELLCKPASNSLGRSDPHNNNNISSPSLNHILGVATLHTMDAESQESSSDTATTSHTSDASHNGVADSPDEDAGPMDAPGEEPVRLPVPRPRAATLVPGGRTDSSAKVAVTLPVPAPHPPPSLHILPPSPKPKHASLSPPTPMSSSVPERKPLELSLDLPERSSTDDLSPLTLGSGSSGALERSLLDAVDNQDGVAAVPMLVSPFSPAVTPTLPPDVSLASNDDNNNPNELHTGSALDSCSEAEGSSSLSTDSIDFFSAREKFLGLAQDGRTRTLSEQTLQKSAPSLSLDEPGESTTEPDEEQGKTSAHGEDEPEKPHPHHHDNTPSVRHIVTEIESISHPASSLPPPSPPLATTLSSPLPPQPRPRLLSRQEEPEDRETGEVSPTVALTPPPCPETPPVPPCDWPAGSVRRVTKQLEQRLKQELEIASPHPAQRSPVHSPSVEQPPARSPLLGSPGAETAPARSLPPPTELTLSSAQRLAQGQTSAKPKDGQTDARAPADLHRLNSSDMDTLPDPSHSPDISVGEAAGTTPTTVGRAIYSHSQIQAEALSEPVAFVVDPSLNTSLHPQPYTQPPSQSQPETPFNPKLLTLSLEGVTANDSDTDHGVERGDQGKLPGCAAPCRAHSGLTRSSQELERIQQTLKELQAFLHDAGSLETGENMEGHLHQPEEPEQAGMTAGDTDFGKGVDFEQMEQGTRERQGRSFREPAGWQRAMELEARIRQAGLTPPSLMKRSASLAKLDCLELSANDLTDWDRRSTSSSGTPSTETRDSASTTPSCPPAQPYLSPDDMWKKQRVLTQTSHPDQTGWSHGDGGPEEFSSPLPTSLSCPHHFHPKEETRDEEETVASGNGPVAMTVGRQQVRVHSSRRSRKASAEKKQRTVTVLYNTM